MDELELKGLGRGLQPVGVAMALAGLLLAGAPVGLLDLGTALAHAAGAGSWVAAAVVFGSALTGATVLRATGRIFLDLGPDPGEEAEAPSQEEQEKADRPLWLMMVPIGLLLLLAVVPAHAALPLLARAAAGLAAPFGGAPPPPVRLTPSSPLPAWVSVVAAVMLAGVNLYRERLPKGLSTLAGVLARPPLKGLKALHSGHVADYVTWIAVGLAIFSAALAAS